MKLKHVDLFSGIGGFALGLKWTGHFKTVLFCEIDDYCQRVLRRHWPDVPIIGDIRDVNERTIKDYDIGKVDLVTAGFPCQPFSNAGKRAGADDERYLWPDLARATRALRPRYVLLENVPGLLSINDGREFGIVLSDLAACGYDAEWQVLPASAFGAWHRRDRVWIVAYLRGEAGQDVPDSWIQQLERPGRIRQSEHSSSSLFGKTDRPFNVSTPQIWQAEPRLGRVAHGIPDQVDRIKALGNGVVPQVVEWIGQQIVAFDKSLTNKL